MPRDISFEATPLTTNERKNESKAAAAMSDLIEAREAGASRAQAQPEARALRDSLRHGRDSLDHRTAQAWTEQVNRHPGRYR